MVENLVSKDLRQPAMIKSANRVLQVFEYFEEVRKPVPLKQIVRDLDYPQSSATVLLKNLLQSGYLNYNRKDRTYFPTTKLFQVSKWLDNIVDPSLVSLLEKIQKNTKETVILAVQNDLYVQYLEVVDSDHEMRFHVKKDSLIPITETSLGWVILSTKTNDQVENICRQVNSRMGPEETQIDIDDYLSSLEKVRQRGYCYVRNLPMRGGGCISLNLPKPIAGQSAAVGTGGLVDRLDENLEFIVDSMKRHIREVV